MALSCGDSWLFRGRGSLPAEQRTSQTSRRRFLQWCNSSPEETFHCNPSKDILKHSKTSGSCCNLLWGSRKLGRYRKGTTPFWLSRVDRQHQVLAMYRSGESSRPVHEAADTFAIDRNSGFREDRVGTEWAVGSPDFSAEGIVPERGKRGITRRLNDPGKMILLDRVQVPDGGSREAGGLGFRSERSERNVEVDVEVVSWRERHIRANVCVEASYQMMWEVLTDYERLPEFIPNLVRSEKIVSPTPGIIRLLQQGVQRALYWQIEARVVLDLEEFPHEANGKELRFSMVDGDFDDYKGRWYLRPGPRSETVMLHYDVNVVPKLIFPAGFVERLIRADLPVNLRALVQRAETDPSEWKSMMRPTKLLLEQPAALSLGAVRGSGKKWGGKQTCPLGHPCAVDEVHLRRLDDHLESGAVHCHVLATITVESPIKDIWDVLTDYERLSDFIPNLASSKIITRDGTQVRLVQEGCKSMLYMVLRACVVLDLWEKPEDEIVFRQVEGDFISFQGKWTLEPLGSQHTLLKCMVDMKMDNRSLHAEAMVEEVIYVDLPTNLCAMRDQVELRKRKTVGGTEAVQDAGKQRAPLGSSSIASVQPKVGRKRFRVAGLQKDFQILERELLTFVSEHGREGHMPMRSELREHRRVDLEKAIARIGGFSAVARRLNLCQQRRPRGYWDNFQNLRHEIVLFQKESGMDGMYMPTRNSLNKAGRHDVGRALEKWGGVQEVARLMGLKVRRVRLRAPINIMSSEVSGLVDDDLTPQKPFKTSLPAKPTKWVDLK